jgi:hypothetical protein
MLVHCLNLSALEFIAIAPVEFDGKFEMPIIQVTENDLEQNESMRHESSVPCQIDEMNMNDKSDVQALRSDLHLGIPLDVPIHLLVPLVVGNFSKMVTAVVSPRFITFRALAIRRL